jgi:hypothetical protein
MRSDSQAGVEHKNTLLRPWRQEAAILWRRRKRWVVILQRDVHVLQARRSGSRRANGEAEAMGLIVVVIWVLTKDYCFHGVQGGVSRPDRLSERGHDMC